MPGPAPSRNPRRTNARPDWRKLPAAGRSGAPPEWPIGDGMPDELVLWGQLWGSPQAKAWEDLGWTRVVARYVQVLLVCENPRTVTAAMLGEARQMEDRLGLSPMAMKRLMWEVESVQEKAAGSGSGVANLDDYRD